MNEDISAIGNFTGTARLFPLPNLVLFPQVVQPLHIFEPRYRQMTVDAVSGDRLLGMALLKPGWEASYEDRPELHPVVCLGRIIAEQRLPDGRFNLLLRGLCRGRILKEVTSEKLYRLAHVEVLSEGPPLSAQPAQVLRRQLAEAAPAWIPSEAPAYAQLQKVLQSELPLGVFCDLLAFALPLPCEAKQSLLEETRPEQRAQRLLALLTKTASMVPQGAPARSFPPDFSSN
jgi:Lon protease-like protein